MPIATVFYAAASARAGLGIWALYQRRQFHWKAIEPIQLVLGLSIPALIITHLAGVRIDHVLFQHQKLYPQVFYSYWIISPYKMWLMFIVLIVSWIHGCIGLYLGQPIAERVNMHLLGFKFLFNEATLALPRVPLAS